VTKFQLGDRVKVVKGFNCSGEELNFVGGIGAVKRFGCPGEEINFVGGIGTITNIAAVSKGAAVYRVSFDDKKTQLLNRYTILYFEEELELLEAEEGQRG